MYSFDLAELCHLPKRGENETYSKWSCSSGRKGIYGVKVMIREVEMGQSVFSRDLG